MNNYFLIREENALPYRFVHYPAFYERVPTYYNSCLNTKKAHASVGPFIGFSETESSEIYFCSCFKTTLEHYIRLYKLNEKIRGHIFNSQKYRNTMFESSVFPLEISMFFVDNHISNVESMQYIKFYDNLCHQCNQASPTETLNYSGYNIFARHYGWYIKKKQFDLGYMDCHCVLDICPDDIKDILAKMAKWNDFYNQETAKSLKKRDYKLMNDCNKRSEAEGRKLRNIIENYVREDFNYKRIGEFWVTETLLYNIIKQVFPNYEVFFHYRPSYLEGLELDIFIKDINLGIEYQGVQHFTAIDFWGGEKALATTQQHDRRKKELCDNNGIQLIYFYYTDEINEMLVRDRLKQFLE